MRYKLLGSTTIAAVVRGVAFIAALELFWRYLKLPMLLILSARTDLLPPIAGHLMPDRSIIVSDLIDTVAAVVIAYFLVATEQCGKAGRLPSLHMLASRTNLAGGALRLRCFGYGIAVGLAAAALLMAVLILAGAEQTTFKPVTSWSAAADFLKLIAVFGVIGVSEEFWFRGYAQRALTDGAGFWAASAITSTWCMWSHYASGDPLIGALHAGLDGLLWCLTLKLTGNLAFAIGYHSAWDFAQSAVFGVPDSTIMYKGHLAVSLANGPDWSTGGSVGPEGSVFSFILLGALLPIALWACAQKLTGSTDTPAA